MKCLCIAIGFYLPQPSVAAVYDRQCVIVLWPTQPKNPAVTDRRYNSERNARRDHGGWRKNVISAPAEIGEVTDVGKGSGYRDVLDWRPA